MPTERLASLSTRRLVTLPPDGPGAVHTDVQGRGWGSDPTTSPAELADLISSIGSVGQLQPILVEQHPDGTRLLVAGERRLLAIRWGNAHHPNNPRFGSVAAVVVDGPLNDEQRRCWQLVENLARTDLQPAELAAALLYERCAYLVARLRDHDVEVPAATLQLDDPVQRFAELDKLRRQHASSAAAPWADVIAHLGLQLSVDKAKALVAALRAIPTEISWEMDALGVSLASRQVWLRLHRGRAEAATDIWAAVRDTERAPLLTRTVTEADHHPGAAAHELVELAAAVHADANDDRAVALRARHAADAQPPARTTDRTVNEVVVSRWRAASAELLEALHDGHALSGYTAGSVRLLADQISDALNASVGDVEHRLGTDDDGRGDRDLDDAA